MGFLEKTLTAISYHFFELEEYVLSPMNYTSWPNIRFASGKLFGFKASYFNNWIDSVSVNVKKDSYYDPSSLSYLVY